MAPEAKRPLKVFLCHASGDKPLVRDLYKRLTLEGVDAWLDKEKLLPGQDWQVEIPRAVREADVVVVCLSNKSLTKEGYVQKEIRFALDIAEEKPEGTIFLIPARLEDCPVPERLSRWQWVDLYEENGFIQLLRSLKLRANIVGAVIEAASYEDTDRERERKLNQLYTEGLEAFYTEDWDRACRRFQAILSEQPNHKNAAEKLEEAQCQGHYAKLYAQAVEECHSENWLSAIPFLDELTQKSPGYKDAVQLLRDARKKKQLTDLYVEAKTLHTAQKWQAVVKVFDQISIIEPNYPDTDGLLESAQKELAELKRLDELNRQYSLALHEMELGNWYEARRLLESVHKSQTGFQETEKLLRKVENEILKEEEKRRQNEQTEVLYEQAHGLLRSRKWRNALDKIEEIRNLDEHFPDTDGIAEKAQKELTREDQEAEGQNKLAALYAEAVKLLREDKYQDALDKWGEVKAIDPKYPDRQRVDRTAKKVLARQGKPISSRPKFVIPKLLWIGLGSVALIAIVSFAIITFGNDGSSLSPASTEVIRLNGTDSIVLNPSTPLTDERIVYSGTSESGDQIFFMDPDGGNIEQLTFDLGQIRRRPSISPNGDKIVFSSGQIGDMNLYLINPDGSDLTNLTELRGDENEPKWSPDGKTIVFSSTRDENREIYSINVDKSGFTRLTNNSADDGSPYWNADGRTIVFSSDRGGDFDIYTMKPDGSELKRITANSSNDSQPSWSPNGDYIAFTSDRDGNNEIYIMKSDGSDQTNMTNHPGNDRYPNWAPDGKHIVFFSDRDGDGNIWIYSMELSSKLIVRLASGGSPFWGVVVSDDKKRPPETLTPTTDGNLDPTMYDDFNNSTYDGSYNKSFWNMGANSTDFVLGQNNGNLTIEVHDKAYAGLDTRNFLNISKPTFVEAQLYLDPQGANADSSLNIAIGTDHGYSKCIIINTGDNAQRIACDSEYSDKAVAPSLGSEGLIPDWHVLRLEIDPEQMTVKYIVDGKQIGSYNSKEVMPDHIDLSTFNVSVHLGNFDLSSVPVGYIDYVRIGAIEDDPTVYDNFDNSEYDGAFDPSK